LHLYEFVELLKPRGKAFLIIIAPLPRWSSLQNTKSRGSSLHIP